MWLCGYENGDPVLGDATDVELAAEWEDSGRPPGDWFQSVLASRWIDDLGDGRYAIHDLLENAPDYVRKRAKRHSERRNKGLRPETADNGGQRRTKVVIDQPPAPAPAPSTHTLNGGVGGFRSALPCDNPELAATAKRVIDHYQRRVKPAHTTSGASAAVIELLLRGRPEAALKAAADAFAAWCDAEGKQARHRHCVRVFYSEGGFEEYADRKPEKKPEDMTDDERREWTRRNFGGDR